ESAAFFVVDLRDVARDLAYTDGTLARRDAVVFDGADPATRNVVTTPIPELVQRTIDARAEYVRLLPKDDRTPIYRQQIAETYFLYGQWGEARTRFEAQWKA